MFVLVFGGGAYGYWTLRQNRPFPMYVPLPMNPQSSVEQRKEIAKELKTRLSDKALLVKVSKDLGLKGKWNLATDEAAADEILKRLYVETSQQDTASGATPTMNIGIDGVKKEREVTGAISTRLMDDVQKILGVDFKTGKAQ